MNGKGRALDNARTERLFRSLKYDDIYINLTSVALIFFPFVNSQ